MTHVRNTLRSVAAVIAGYAVIVIGTVLTLTVILDDVSYAEATLGQHTFGAVGTVASGLAAGWICSWIARRRPIAHSLGVVAILTVEMTWILTQGIGPNPAWFDALGGATLMIATVVGAWLWSTRRERSSTAAPA